MPWTVTATAAFRDVFVYCDVLKATRSSAALLALAAIALISVTALSLQAGYAWEQQRLADARMRDNIAVIATRNFTSRVGVVIANYVGAALEPLQQLQLDERQLRARLHDVRDSLAECACQTPFQIGSIRVVDTTGVAFDGEVGADSSAALRVPVRRADQLGARPARIRVRRTRPHLFCRVTNWHRPC